MMQRFRKQRNDVQPSVRGAIQPLVAWLLVTLLLGLANTGLAQSNKNDVIWLENAKTVSGRIEDSKPEHIAIVVSGKQQRIPVESITRLRLRDDPTGMASVRAAVQAGNYEQADTQLKSIRQTGRPVTRQDLAFHRVLIRTRLALQGTGKITDAAREVGGFIKSYPASFRYFEACELMGDLAMSLGRYDSAVNYYGKIGQSPSKALAARGQLLQGNAQLKNGAFEKAAAHFRAAKQSGIPKLATMSNVGLAVCDIEKGNPSSAITSLETIIRDNDHSDFELFGRCYNALGLAYQATGQQEAALDAYLHTHLLFYRNQEAHAEALYHLTSLWTDAKNPQEASKARNTLKTRFASSTWARK